MFSTEVLGAAKITKTDLKKKVRKPNNFAAANFPRKWKKHFNVLHIR